MAKPPSDEYEGVQMGSPSPGPGFFAGLPNWAKGITVALSIPALVLAFSGNILGISAGPIIERYIDRSFDNREQVMLQAIEQNREDIVKTVLDSIDQDITPRLDAIDQRMTAIEDKLASVEHTAITADDRVAKVEGHIGNLTARVDALEINSSRLTAVERWVCDNDGLPPEGCTLDQYRPEN